MKGWSLFKTLNVTCGESVCIHLHMTVHDGYETLMEEGCFGYGNGLEGMEVHHLVPEYTHKQCRRTSHCWCKACTKSILKDALVT